MRHAANYTVIAHQFVYNFTWEYALWTMSNLDICILASMLRET